MAVEKCSESEEILNSVKSNIICEGRIFVGKIIPVSKWHVWCYEKWRFAPGLQQYPVDSEIHGQHFIYYMTLYTHTMDV